MLLALVLSVQATTATAVTAPNPCADQLSELCKISALFCPSAYPTELTPGNGNNPCWPDKTLAGVSHDTRTVDRPSGTMSRPASASTAPTASSVSTESQETREGFRARISRLWTRLLER